FTAPIRGEVTGARIAQYLGHIGGSLLFVYLVLVIARSGRLERWYGREAVAAARQIRPGTAERLAFWLVVAVPTAVAVVAAPGLDRSPLFLPITVATIALLAAGTVVRSGAGRSTAGTDHRARPISRRPTAR
ncbi:MAG: hypothetical protein ACR2QK_05080, partial [Acidimicrobiales bacterium]